ncbi:hypothetical protein [Xenorhabdus kozodoii]|uniref:Sulfide dehydrogenase n=1 Tax=Xenorhabdus kozodoii TaxID=351676 RepID=A0A2D0LF96_9GAMM|nr:hypothetical protein [Xenorhabdus kozodoii]PHM74331.1 sulfide dehydrogenase [Xenorhabdus kozodoii]
MIFNTDNFWIRTPQKITSIATLGPEGTSSQSAAKYLTNLIGGPLDILLFDTFELASEYVEQIILGTNKRIYDSTIDLQEHRFINGSGEVTDF